MDGSPVGGVTPEVSDQSDEASGADDGTKVPGCWDRSARVVRLVGKDCWFRVTGPLLARRFSW